MDSRGTSRLIIGLSLFTWLLSIAEGNHFAGNHLARFIPRQSEVNGEGVHVFFDVHTRNVAALIKTPRAARSRSARRSRCRGVSSRRCCT
jgi:hypothetical protein